MCNFRYLRVTEYRSVGDDNYISRILRTEGDWFVLKGGRKVHKRSLEPKTRAAYPIIYSILPEQDSRSILCDCCKAT